MDSTEDNFKLTRTQKIELWWTRLSFSFLVLDFEVGLNFQSCFKDLWFLFATARIFISLEKSGFLFRLNFNTISLLSLTLSSLTVSLSPSCLLPESLSLSYLPFSLYLSLFPSNSIYQLQLFPPLTLILHLPSLTLLTDSLPFLLALYYTKLWSGLRGLRKLFACQQNSLPEINVKRYFWSISHVIVFVSVIFCVCLHTLVVTFQISKSVYRVVIRYGVL